MRIRPPSFGSPVSRGHVPRAEALLATAVLAAVATSAPAQHQFDELRKRTGLPANQDNTRAVAFGDVDGDGDLDIVCGNRNSRSGYYSPRVGGRNRLYLNTGSGTYADATVAQMPADTDITYAVALGDVDGDGDLDIVCGNYDYRVGQQNRLYLNDGSGTFADATASQLPADSDPTHDIALGDVDGDGDLDIVFGNDPTLYGANGQNRLYLNDGSGTFTDVTATRLPADNDTTRAVALGDVDGDGDLDMVSANYGYLNPEQNRLYINDGTGSFSDATAAQMPTVLEYTNAVATGDVDGDGDLDIVFGNYAIGLRGQGQSRLYLNDGAGNYSDATATRMPARRNSTRAVALDDVDGDGDLDMVVGNGGQNQIFLNDASGIFSDATARMPFDTDYTQAVAVGDVDGDGDLDIVCGNHYYTSGQENRLYLNNGSGTFVDAASPRVPAVLDSTLAVALGDVDGDGDVDLVSGNRDSSRGQQNRLQLNDGSGFYTDATIQRMPVDTDLTEAMALGDVDGDADLDLVIANNGQNRLYLNDGSGSYTDATTQQMPVDSDNSKTVALGDVDGDADLDIVFSGARLYLNNGSGTFADATAARMPAGGGAYAAVLGDVDGDGDLDLVLGVYRGQNRLYLNDGSGTYTDVTAARIPMDTDSTRAVALGDVDGDGDGDLVFGNGLYPGQSNRLYLNDGFATFIDATAARLPANNDNTRAVALGDIDGDGDLDIVFGNVDCCPSNPNRLYLNDGSGTYIDTTARMPADKESTNAVVLGDVDGDGDLDMVLGNGSVYPLRQQNQLYLNLLRQLDAPFLARTGRTFTLEAYARYRPPSLVDVALPFISTAPASIPFPPFGAIGVDPNRMLALSPFVIRQPAGVGSISFTIPNVPGLVGASVYSQALLVPYPFQERLTNVTADVIIR